MKSCVVAAYTMCMYIPGQYEDSINIQTVYAATTRDLNYNNKMILAI